LKARIATVRTERDSAKATLDRALTELSAEARITDDKVAEFVEIMRQNVANGEKSFRRAYLRSVFDRVAYDEVEVRIVGRHAVMERLVMETGAAPSSVPSSVLKWRTRDDSNIRPLPSEGSALSS